MFRKYLGKYVFSENAKSIFFNFDSKSNDWNKFQHQNMNIKT